MNLLFWYRSLMRSVGATLVKLIATSTSGIVSFTTNVIRPVKVTCEFSPVQEGTGDPSPDNVRPISGWTGCNIEHRGKNLFNVSRAYAPVEPPTFAATTPRTFDVSKYYCGYRNIGTYSDIGNKISINNGVITFLDTGTYLYGAAFPLKLKPDVQYMASFIQSGITGVTVSFYDAEGIYTGWAYAGGGVPISGYKFTVPAGTETVLLVINGNGGATISNFQIEQDTTASSYEPYQGNTLPINWQTEAGTVYGGTVTLNEDGSADLVSEYEIVNVGNLRTYNTPKISGDFAAQTFGPFPRYFLAPKNGNEMSLLSGIPCNCLIEKSGYWYNSIAYISSDTEPCFAVQHNASGITAYMTVFLKDSTLTTAASFKEKVSEMGIQICGHANVPIATYHFPSIAQLNSFLGTNNIWHNMNGDITVEYWNKQ